MISNFVVKSAVGLARPNNEDAVCCAADRGLFAVADGMGGGDEGERASQLVAAELERRVSSEDFATRVEQIRAAIAAANDQIGAYQREHHLRQMGSTVAVLAFDAARTQSAAILHVGDSRVYRLREGKAELLTHDHTVGAELAAKVGGSFGTDFSARANPLAHVLTRAIGTGSKVEVESREALVQPGDRFLVCTDGVHDVIATDELPKILRDPILDRAAQMLEREVLARGAPDNYSFILVETERTS